MPTTRPKITRSAVPSEVVRAEASALRALFDAYVATQLEQHRRRVSQMQFGADNDIGTQGMVWQYLNGERPLNIEAAERFARGLGVSISAFSPRLAQLARRAAQVAYPVDAQAANVRPDLAEAVLSLARAIADGDHTARRRAQDLVDLFGRPAISDAEVEHRMPVTRKPREGKR